MRAIYSGGIKAKILYFYHSAVHNYRDNHRQNFQTPAYDKGFQCQRHQFANRHRCHCRLHLHGKRTNINGGIATDNAGGRIYHRLSNVKYRHCNIERMTDEIDAMSAGTMRGGR